jgi:hypothetical protein
VFGVVGIQGVDAGARPSNLGQELLLGHQVLREAGQGGDHQAIDAVVGQSCDRRS